MVGFEDQESWISATPLSANNMPQKVLNSAPASPIMSSNARHRGGSTAKIPHITAGDGSTISTTTMGSGDAHDASTIIDMVAEMNRPDDDGYPRIVRQASIGSKAMVNRLLASGADINAINVHTKRTALCEASLRGHEDVVETLVDQGCTLDSLDMDGYSALHYASKQGNLSIAKSLIVRRANLNLPGPHKQAPLHLAVSRCHNNIVMLLLQNQVDLSLRDVWQQSALHVAAERGDVLMCKILLDHGAQLGDRDAESKTALQLACERGHADVVELLLGQSKMKPTDHSLVGALYAALEYGHVQIAQTLIDKGLKPKKIKKESHKPITLAAKSGNLDMVELVIQEKCAIKDKNEHDWNALHFASHHGHHRVVERLILKDLSVKATTTKRETPLILAAKGGHFGVVEILLRHKASVSSKDVYDQQPIHHAIRSGSLDVFNLLILHGARVDVANAFGWWPIHIAAAYGHEPLVKRILEEGGRIEEKLKQPSVKRDTHKIVTDGCWAEARWPYPLSRPLHLACEFSHTTVARTLVASGAKIDASCSQGWRPLHLAAFNALPESVSLLLDSGADVQARTNERRTPMDLCFRTAGNPISKHEKSAVLNTLREAAERNPRRISLKLPGLRKGKNAADKNDAIKKAIIAMQLISENRAVGPRRSMTDPGNPSQRSIAGGNTAPPRLMHTLELTRSKESPPPYAEEQRNSPRKDTDGSVSPRGLNIQHVEMGSGSLEASQQALPNFHDKPAQDVHTSANSTDHVHELPGESSPPSRKRAIIKAAHNSSNSIQSLLR